ncbi:hypothetical protein SNK05_002953 [Fusarium graminearum]
MLQLQHCWPRWFYQASLSHTLAGRPFCSRYQEIWTTVRTPIQGMINRSSRNDSLVRSLIGGGVMRQSLNALHAAEDPHARYDNVFAQTKTTTSLTRNEQRQILHFSGRNCNIE